MDTALHQYSGRIHEIILNLKKKKEIVSIPLKYNNFENLILLWAYLFFAFRDHAY